MKGSRVQISVSARNGCRNDSATVFPFRSIRRYLRHYLPSASAKGRRLSHSLPLVPAEAAGRQRLPNGRSSGRRNAARGERRQAQVRQGKIGAATKRQRIQEPGCARLRSVTANSKALCNRNRSQKCASLPGDGAHPYRTDNHNPAHIGLICLLPNVYNAHRASRR